MYLIGIAALLSLGVYLAFFSRTEPPRIDDSHVLALLRWVDSADAEVDASKAIAGGHPQFLGVLGYGPYVPGTQVTDSALIRKTGVRFLDGTSDMLLSDEHGRLVHAAIKYAEEYNLVLLRHLEIPGEGPDKK